MKLIKQEDGAAMVEFALVITILLLIVFGIIEFGRIFNAQLTVTHAAREGARVGVVTPVTSRDTVIKNTVKDRAASITLTDANIVIDPVAASTGESMTVTVNYNVDLVAPFISAILPDPFPVHGQAVMRVE